MGKKYHHNLLSIIIPCFNEEQNIFLIVKQIVELEINRNIEILFVDDGSEDDSWQKIIDAQKFYSKIEINALKFTRNFGKEAAIESGLRNCLGGIVITIDCDLQHPIRIIPKMIKLWERNKDIHIINAVKETRQNEGLVKRLMANIYYYIFNLSTGLNLKNHSDFKLIDRIIINDYLKFKESSKFYRGLTQWLGYESITLNFTPEVRKYGSNSWTLGSLFKYAKTSILCFSYIPLKIISWLGLSLVVFSLILTIDTVIKKINGSSAEGFPTVILLQLGIGSLVLFSLGIIGEYLSEIYKEIKNRPSYILSRKVMRKKK